MARGPRRRSSRQLRWTPYPVPSRCWKDLPEKEERSKKASLELEKRVWEDAICPVCMEYPHNAVLLLCSSHDKGCRPYMCETSYRHSNCLDQFKKAYTKVTSTTHHHGLGLAMSRWSASEKSEVMELPCPLCRGQVKRWTVVQPAREYLNNKDRSCMQDNCSFVGTYRELHKHVKSKHPSAKPREVDPVLEQNSRTLEHEMEQQDDNVIDVNNSDLELDDEAGDDDGHYEGGGSHGIVRSILNIFSREGIVRSILNIILREVALVMGLHEENSSSEDSEEEDDVYAPSVNGAGAVAGAADIISANLPDSNEDLTPVASHGRGAGVLRSEA